jgi:hypothetical protein
MVLGKEQFMKSSMTRVVLLAIIFLSGCGHKHHSPKTVADIKTMEMSPPMQDAEASRAEAENEAVTDAPAETEVKPVAKSIPPRKHVSAAKASKRRNAKASKRPEPETVSPPPDSTDADHRFPVGLLAFLPLAAAGIWMFAKSKDG